LEQFLMSIVANGAQYPQSGATDTLQSTIFSDSRPDNLGSKNKANGSSVVVKDPEVDQLTGALGFMHLDQAHSESVYVGGAHWLSIMCQVSPRVRGLEFGL
jgi:hypothetical protein